MIRRARPYLIAAVILAVIAWSFWQLGRRMDGEAAHLAIGLFLGMLATVPGSLATLSGRAAERREPRPQERPPQIVIVVQSEEQAGEIRHMIEERIESW